METLLLPNARKGALRIRDNFLEIIQLELVFLSVQLELLQIISLKDAFKFVLLVNCIMEIHQLVIVFLSVLSTPSYMLII